MLQSRLHELRQLRPQAPWSRTYNEHVGFMNDINFAGWLDNLVQGFKHVLNLSLD